jgi:hypothetical protein
VGLPYAREVPFTYVDRAGNTIVGQFDYVFMDPNYNELMFIELKGDNPLVRSTPGQAVYMNELMDPAGGSITIAGPGKSGIAGSRLALTPGQNVHVSAENFVTVWKGNMVAFSEAMGTITGNAIRNFVITAGNRLSLQVFRDPGAWAEYLRSIGQPMQEPWPRRGRRGTVSVGGSLFLAVQAGQYLYFIKDARNEKELLSRTLAFGGLTAADTAIGLVFGPAGAFVSMSSDNPERAAQIEQERIVWDLMEKYFPDTVGSFMGFRWLRDPQRNGHLFNELLTLVRTPPMTASEFQTELENEMSDQ